MAAQSLDERLEALEERVADLEKRAPQKQPPWWEQWFGAFKDNPDFDAAMEKGAEYRRSQPTAADEIDASVSA